MWNWLFSQDSDEDEPDYTQQESAYVKKLYKLYRNKYDYSNVRIINKYSKITLICSCHGEFSGSQYCMLLGNGCPKCKSVKRLSRVVKHYNNGTKNM
jgi:hypothetical protein